MEYMEFKDKAYQALATNEDLISFNVPESALFQEILNDPYSYLSNVNKLMADSEIPYEVKLGAAAALISLDIPDLAKFVNYLNDLSKENPKLFDIAQHVAFNTYRGSSFVRQSLISQQDLSKHANKPYVWQVFKNLYDNPHHPEKERYNKNSYLYNIVNQLMGSN